MITNKENKLYRLRGQNYRLKTQEGCLENKTVSVILQICLVVSKNNSGNILVGNQTVIFTEIHSPTIF